MSDYGSILKDFKDLEHPSALIPLMKSDQLREGLTAWKTTPVQLSGANETCPKTEFEQWEWLWDGVRVKMKMFAYMLGISEKEAQSVFQRLQALRLIYPDNTIHSFADKYLSSIIMQEIQKGVKKKSGAGRPPKES